MKCTHCHMNEANTHIQRIINGHKEEMYLCDDCTKELGVMDDFSFEPFSVDSLFGNLIGVGANAFNSFAGFNSISNHGSIFSNIADLGHRGLEDYYEELSDAMPQSSEKSHGNVKHIGKNVTYTETTNGKNTKPNNTLSQLKEELKKAVKEQRFEDAAVLRDKIKEIDKEN